MLDIHFKSLKERSPNFRSRLIAAAVVLSCVTVFINQSTALSYLSPEEFVSSHFTEVPGVSMLWLSEEQRAVAKRILGHPYQGLRVRYWASDARTVWIMDEIGKERPITIGIVIDEDTLVQVKILDYRELRGGEIRHAFFTQQFVNARLSAEHQLTNQIDGISGATLSVHAVTNVSRLALYLHQAVKAL